MEHEVYVPFSVGSVRAALAERERVARCVPGLQRDAADEGADSLTGRLRVRIGGSTITYRGSLTLTSQGDGFTVEGSGTEARGSGSAELSLTLVPRVAEDGDGTRLAFAGTVTGRGRISDYEDKTAVSAGKRLLDRFCTALTESLRESGGEPDDTADGPDTADGSDTAGAGGEVRIDARQAAGLGEPDDNERAIPGIPGPEKGERDATGPAQGRRDGEDDAARDDARDGGDARDDEQAGSDAADDGARAAAAPDDETTGGIFETEIPPSSLDPLSDDVDEEFAADALEDDAADEAATAEAAHARRTMIGRSAEEVDHAPPRGRYAPMPSPESTPASATLRWAAPAAAAVLAGAVVLTRALRRRG